jgi:hypothetical protein
MACEDYRGANVLLRALTSRMRDDRCMDGRARARTRHSFVRASVSKASKWTTTVVR